VISAKPAHTITEHGHLNIYVFPPLKASSLETEIVAHIGICVTQFSLFNLLQHSAFLPSEAAITGDIYWVAGKFYFLKPIEEEADVLQQNFATARI
jgi:hypothetical protein